MSNLADTPLALLLRRLWDLMLLNFLCIICSLPIITIGASISAMYSVSMKITRWDSTPVIKGFFIAFKENFLQATLLGLIVIIPTVMAAGDILFALANPGIMQTVFLIVGCIVGLIALIFLVNSFVLQANYKNTLKGHLINSLLVAAANPVKFLLCIVCWAVPWALFVLIPEYFMMKLGAAYLMWGISGPGYLTVLLLKGVFDKIRKEDKENPPENEI